MSKYFLTYFAFIAVVVAMVLIYAVYSGIKPQ